MHPWMYLLWVMQFMFTLIPGDSSAGSFVCLVLKPVSYKSVKSQMGVFLVMKIWTALYLHTTDTMQNVLYSFS